MTSCIEVPCSSRKIDDQQPSIVYPLKPDFTRFPKHHCINLCKRLAINIGFAISDTNTGPVTVRLQVTQSLENSNIRVDAHVDKNDRRITRYYYDINQSAPGGSQLRLNEQQEQRINS